MTHLQKAKIKYAVCLRGYSLQVKLLRFDSKNELLINKRESLYDQIMYLLDVFGCELGEGI